MLNKYDFCYNHENSLVHRLNPYVKLCGFLIYIVLCFLRFNFYIFAFNVMLVFFLIMFSKVKIIRYLNSLWRIKYFLVIIIFVLRFMKVNIIISITELLFGFLYWKLIVFTTTKKLLSESLGSVITLGIGKKKVILLLDKIFYYKECFINNFNQYVSYMDIKGNDYGFLLVYQKFVYILLNIKIIVRRTNKDVKLYEKSRKMFFIDDKIFIRNKAKFCWFDYVLLFIYFMLIIFYVLKVR